MKYIRTKDGIINVEFYKRTYENEKVLYVSTGNGLDKRNYIFEALKEADTIEELCDEFVAIGTKDNYIARTIYNNFDKELFTNLKCKASGFEIYGAIWTDKGLIYVAKMNEKGELELL